MRQRGLVWGVRPSLVTKLKNSKPWEPMKKRPANAVAASQIRSIFWSPRLAAARPSTMVKELSSRTKAMVLTKTRLESTSPRSGVPGRTLFWYTRNVPMRVAKSMQSEPRKSHMATFRWLCPVLVR